MVDVLEWKEAARGVATPLRMRRALTVGIAEAREIFRLKDARVLGYDSGDDFWQVLGEKDVGVVKAREIDFVDNYVWWIGGSGLKSLSGNMD